MSDSDEEVILVINSEFWERVRLAASAISDELKRTTASDVDHDVSMGEATTGMPCAPDINPISPVPSSSGVPASYDSSNHFLTSTSMRMFDSEAQTTSSFAMHLHSVSPVRNPQHDPRELKEETKILPDAQEADRGAMVCIATTITAPSTQVVRERKSPEASPLESDSHEGMTSDDNTWNDNTSADGTNDMRTNVSISPLRPASSSVSIPFIASSPMKETITHTQKALSPLRTVAPDFLTSAVIQPAYRAATDELDDPAMLLPYITNKAITSPIQHGNQQTGHGSATRTYMNRKVTPTLLEGLKAAAVERPEKPLSWLGKFLMQKSAEVETKERRELLPSSSE